MKMSKIRIIIFSIIVIIMFFPVYIYAVSNITTSKYVIDTYYIRNIYPNETVENFMKNIQINSTEKYEVYNDTKVMSSSDIIGTGMTLKSDGYTYVLLVMGDMNNDGKLTAVDLSVVMQATVRLRTLDGDYFKAADINNDGKLTAVDISRVKLLIVGLLSPDNEDDSVVEIKGTIRMQKSTNDPAKSVKITVSWPNEINGLIKQISKDGGLTYSDYTDDFDVDENGDIFARLIDAKTKSLKLVNKLTITNIDLTPPNEFSFSVVRGEDELSVIGVTTDIAEDKRGAAAAIGIARVDRYEYSLNGTDWQRESRFLNLNPDLEYRVYVKAVDAAGNERMANNNGEVVSFKNVVTNTLIDATTVEEAIRNNLKPANINWKLETSDKKDIWVPKGFKFVENVTSSADGIIVEDENGNQFVWIPVDDVNTMYEERTIQTYIGETKKIKIGKVYSDGDINNPRDLTEDYTEPKILKHEEFGDVSPNSISILKSVIGLSGIDEEIVRQFELNLINEFNEMIESVKVFKGFYVGRYETSFDENRYVKIDSSESSNSDKIRTWYGLYQKQKEFSKNNNLDDVVGSSMIWGSQYDQIFIWLAKNGVNLKETFAGKREVSKENDIIKNIYALYAGGTEWILEGEFFNRYMRGYYYDKDDPNPPTGDLGIPWHQGSISRITLYIK